SSPAASGASANGRRNVRRRRKAKGTVSEALRTRVLTAVVLAAVLLAVVLWLPAWATRAVVTAVVLAGAWEWSAFLRVPATSARGAYVLLVAALLALAWRVSASPGGGAALARGGGGRWGVRPPCLRLRARRVRAAGRGPAGARLARLGEPRRALATARGGGALVADRAPLDRVRAAARLALVGRGRRDPGAGAGVGRAGAPAVRAAAGRRM